MKVNFAFHLEIKVWSLEEDWRGIESKQLEVQCEVSEVRDDLGAVTSAGVGPLCFIKSRVNAAVYQEILEHFIFAPLKPHKPKSEPWHNSDTHLLRQNSRKARVLATYLSSNV